MKTTTKTKSGYEELDEMTKGMSEADRKWWKMVEEDEKRKAGK